MYMEKRREEHMPSCDSYCLWMVKQNDFIFYLSLFLSEQLLLLNWNK